MNERQARAAHELHRRVGPEAERGPHRGVGQVVGVAQQQGGPLPLGQLVQGLGEHDLVVVDGQHPAAERQVGVARRHPTAQVAGPGEPPADGVRDLLGLRSDHLDEVQRAGLDDLDGLVGAAAQPPDEVVHAVQVDPDRSDQVLGGHARRAGLRHPP